MRSQRTVKKEIYFEGIGLHTGEHCKVWLRPAPVDHGIVFHRLDRNAMFHVNVGLVTDTAFATAIGNERVNIRTVEHLLSTLSALCIDNLFIELIGPEIPILDGSAIEISTLIMNAGYRKQRKKMPFIRILKPVILEEEKASVAIFPYDGRRITFRLFFENHFMGEQIVTIDLTEDTFIHEIAPARTFGFLKNLEYIRSKGLAKGGSLDNALVLSETAVINETGLRFPDECVRHKILDIIGDFSLVGFPIKGHIVADKAGHTINVNFLNKLLTCTKCWEVVADTVPYAIPVASYSYI
ncbi:UDP-3-O-[3-hydroxymyristoyl] N-acetylglucosamine deacetylase [Candidatus Magnetoovum chiemensis]|nr:UDP-3-O-[3-hydroxymyristoyl] N-acetylglucosamine deacetylase [Candidatus Magnetoovum chiemensis]